jgi:hypothetical protein
VVDIVWWSGQQDLAPRDRDSDVCRFGATARATSLTLRCVTRTASAGYRGFGDGVGGAVSIAATIALICDISAGEAMMMIVRLGATKTRACGKTPDKRAATVGGERILSWYVSTAVAVGFFVSIPLAIVRIPCSS